MFCSDKSKFSGLLKYKFVKDSVAHTTENVQQLPHCPWSFIDVVRSFPCTFLQSKLSTKFVDQTEFDNQLGVL